MHTIKMAREFYPEAKGARFVAISPCIAKRREFDEVGLGDFNVTIASIEAHMKRKGLARRAPPDGAAGVPGPGFEDEEDRGHSSRL